jgi:hypothetical protein
MTQVAVAVRCRGRPTIQVSVGAVSAPEEVLEGTICHFDDLMALVPCVIWKKLNHQRGEDVQGRVAREVV